MLIVTASSVDYEVEVKIELDGPVGFSTMEVMVSSIGKEVDMKITRDAPERILELKSDGVTLCDA